MKRWLRRVIVFMTLIAMTANCDTVLAASYNLNNSLDKVDYKVSDEQFIIDTEEDDDAIFEENVRRDFTTINNQVDEYLVAAKSYLIETGILDRPINISYESDYTAQYNEAG